MTDPTVHRAIAILAAAPAVALPLTDLARELGYVDLDALASRLAADPRLRVLDLPAFPEIVGPSPDRAADYDRALRAAGLRGDRRVARVGPAALPPGAGLGALLRSTTGLLLAGGAEGLVDAAERVNRILRAALPDEP